MSRREVDAGGTFVVWASPAEGDISVPAGASCGHGASVDMRFDTLVPECSIVLSVRETEHADGAVHAAMDRSELKCRLESGECVANDAAGEDFLATHPWFAARLQPWMGLVRDRAARAAAQADRRTSARRAFEAHERGKMIAFDELFPADWDLLVMQEGRPYWVVDLYCVKPNCDCGELVFDIHELAGDGAAPKIGSARINVREPETKIRATSSLVIEIYNSLWAESKERLRARLHEVRRALREHASSSATAAATVASSLTIANAVRDQPRRARPARNEPCSCGSGKKFKRCCLGAPTSARS